MTNGPAGRAIQHLHGAVLARADELSDAELLELFVTRQDEAAFEALVLRHGPMVLGVCRRILGDSHDAEDAFQAAFLVLVRKANSIVPRTLVANWLYGVAFRTANKARVMNAKRRAREMKVRERSTPEEAHEELFWRDLLPLLDRELATLPAKYRTAIVLCDLQGKSRKDASRQLGWPEGTLSSRLAAGRKMLALRLGRRGVSFSAGALPLALGHTAASPVPSTLVASTVKAGLAAAAGPVAAAAGVSTTVVALTDSVIKGMLLAKLKVIGTVVCGLAALGAWVGLFITDGARPVAGPAFTLAAPTDGNAGESAARTLASAPPASAGATSSAPALPASQPAPGKVGSLVNEQLCVVAVQPASPLSGAPHSAPKTACYAVHAAIVGCCDDCCTIRIKSRRTSGATTESQRIAWKIVVVKIQRSGTPEPPRAQDLGNGMILINVSAGPIHIIAVRADGSVG